jgi:hypothetical protein
MEDSVIPDQSHFLDQLLIPVSSNMLPPKRLRISEILRLRVKDEFILFVPPENKNNPAEMCSTREYIIDRMQRMITQTFSKSTTAAEREAYFEEELKAREVEREGRVGHEFHVRILSYPERDQMSVDRLPSHEINFLLNPKTGVGITVQLLGYNTTNACLIKLHNIPFLEFYVPRKIGDPAYNEVKISRSKTDNVVATCVARELLETKGDCLAFIGVLLD